MDEKTSSSPGIGITPITAITPILCSSPPVSCSALTFHDGFYELCWSGNQQHWHRSQKDPADPMAGECVMHATPGPDDFVCEPVEDKRLRSQSPWLQSSPPDNGLSLSPVSCSPHKRWKKKCTSRRALVSSVLCFACSLVLVLAYCLVGTVLFRSLQLPNDRVRSEHMNLLRNKTVLKLWNITDQFNVLYKENWTALVSNEIVIFEQELFDSIRRQAYGGFDVHTLPFVSLFFCDCSKSQSHQLSGRKGSSETREDCH